MHLDQPFFLKPWKRTVLPWLAAAVILVTGSVVAGVWYYQVQNHMLRQEVWTDLNGIADLKVREISEWRRFWLAEAELLRGVPSLVSSIEALVKGDEQRARLAVELLDGFQRTEQAKAVVVLSPRGEPIRAFPPRAQATTARMRLLACQSLDNGKTLLSNFDRDERGEIELGLLVPMVSATEPKKPVAVLLVVLDPYKYLYPFIQNWPTPSKTAETLLVRREGDQVLFLNELRHVKGTALALSLPLTLGSLPASRAVLGLEGSFEGLDYRGVPVLSVTRTIPGSGWALVAKVDKAEAYAGVRRMSGLTALQLVLLIAALTLAAGLVLAEKLGRMRERRMQAEKAHGDLQKRTDELQLLASHLDMREEESRTISREIHEELGNSLVGARFALFDLQARIPPHHPELARSVRPILTHMETLIEHVRRISRLVRPPVLDQLGLAAAINWLAEDFSLRTKIKTEVQIHLRDEGADPKRAYASAFYRVCQEALSNVARHSDATCVSICLRESGTDAVLEIADDGKGFDAAHLEPGVARTIGLVNMRERATYLGGTLAIGSSPGNGTRVRVRVPLDPDIERANQDAGMDQQAQR